MLQIHPEVRNAKETFTMGELLLHTGKLVTIANQLGKIPMFGPTALPEFPICFHLEISTERKSTFAHKVMIET